MFDFGFFRWRPFLNIDILINELHSRTEIVCFIFYLYLIWFEISFNPLQTAFRAKAKEFHPDQNQDNKEAAEAKFKEVMVSYEAIKQERKDMKS